jgi:hypothetical protein
MAAGGHTSNKKLGKSGSQGNLAGAGTRQRPSVAIDQASVRGVWSESWEDQEPCLRPARLLAPERHTR